MARKRQQVGSLFTFAKSLHGPQRGRHAELEEDLAQYVNEVRSRCVTITVEMLQMKAREMAHEHGISRTVFKASKGWVKRFMNRAGFSLRRRTSVCQRLPADFEEKLMSFQRYVIGLRRQHGYGLGQIGNADHTNAVRHATQLHSLSKKLARKM